MDINFSVSLPQTTVGTGDFFRNLSKKDGLLYGHGYEKQFEINFGRTANGLEYQIKEASLPWRIHPLRLFMKPVSPERKVLTAKNLTGLVAREKENILADAGCNVNRIVAAFERIRDHMIRNTTGNDRSRILDSFNAAIESLQSAKFKHEADFYGNGRGAGLSAAKSLSSSNFYQALSRTWWPFWFNKRFQIIEPTKGQYEVHLTSRPWFFQKLVKWPSEITSLKFWKDFAPQPVAGTAKVATAQKLEAMIKADKNLIRFMQPNIDGMMQNLTSIKGRMTRNTNSFEKKEIETAFEGAIKELGKVRTLINKDKNNSWKTWMWNHTAVPVWNWGFVPAGKTVQYLGSKGIDGLIAIAKLPVYFLSGVISQIRK